MVIDPASVMPDLSASPKDRIIDALMSLAAERPFEEITIADVAARAGVSLSQFRELYPSKGAVLGGFSRRIDKVVLDGISSDLDEESDKERLFDVLMRRLDAMTPYRDGLKGVVEWAKREPLAAAALNSQVINSMRFMLEAARLDSEGPMGTLKLQGLALAWTRVLDVWFADEDPGLARTMAALDRMLKSGGSWVKRLEDMNRLTSPLRALARAILSPPKRESHRTRPRWGDDDRDTAPQV